MKSGDYVCHAGLNIFDVYQIEAIHLGLNDYPEVSLTTPVYIHGRKTKIIPMKYIRRLTKQELAEYVLEQLGG